MNEYLQKKFGELRGLLNACPFGKEQQQELIEFLADARKHAPWSYKDEWVPYLQGFVDHWTDDLHLEFQSLEELQRTAICLPFPIFHFSPSRCYYAKEIVRLVAAPAMSCVVELDLNRSRIGTRGCCLLVDSERIQNLHTLRIRNNSFGKLKSAEAFANSPYLKSLRCLDITDNRLTDEGFLKMLGSPCMEGLTELHIGHNNLGQASIEALAHAETSRSLTWLDLRRAPPESLSQHEAKALAQSPYLCNLERLELGKLSVASSLTLSTSPHLKKELRRKFRLLGR